MNQIIQKFSVFTSQEFVFLVLALILFLDVLYFLWNFLGTKFFIKKSSKASAVVAEAKMVGEGDEQYQELTLIYRDESGMEFAPVVVNNFKPRARGQRVEVYYKKNDPADVRIKDWRAMWMKSLVSFVAAIVTLWVGNYLMGKGILVVVKFW
jgi:hypothetical protein